MEAISKRLEGGIVTLDSSLCIGCGCCVDACPYGAIQVDPSSGVAGKCDFCLELQRWGEQPACVSACTMRVLHAGWLEEMEVGGAPDGSGLSDQGLTQPAMRVIPKPDSTT